MAGRREAIMTDIAIEPKRVEAASRPRLALLALGFRAHLPLFALALIIVSAETWAELYFRLPVQAGFAQTIVLCMIGGLPAIVVSVAIERLVHLVRHVKPKSPIAALSKEMWAYLGDRRRLANGIPAYLALVALIYAYGRLKPVIPSLHPFSWDATLHHLDKALHFGVEPWRLLQPVFGNLPMTILIDTVYCLWFAAMYFVFTHYAFAVRHTVARWRFFIAFFLVWSIGGMLLAVCFSSAGPVFYTLAGNAADPYAPLMAQIRGYGESWPLFALEAQKLLADSYRGGEGGLIAGISAMPSLHNATATLLAFAGFQISRKLGWAGIAFAAGIFLGSIHLGWHYAVDGYFGIAFAMLIWWVSGPIARAIGGDEPSLRFAEALDGRF